MPQHTVLFVAFDLVAILSLLIGIFVASLILFITVRKVPRQHPIIDLLLSNTCVCTLQLCFSNLIIYGYIFLNDTAILTSPPSLHEQLTLCPIRSYFLFTGFALLYTSYCLQAYYRLRQVIFYKEHDHFNTFVCLCLAQWIFSHLLTLPMLLTHSFVYLPEEFFCPIPFFKPLSVIYIAVCVYGIFVAIFTSIYYRIYVYATRVTLVTLQRRRTVDRQLTMLKRMILPAFSLLFLGIVYLSQFFQAVANQYQTHFLTYRLSYFFIAFGMGFMHIITIVQTPSLKRTVLELFQRFRNTNTTTQELGRKNEEMVLLSSRTANVQTVKVMDTSELILTTRIEDEDVRCFVDVRERCCEK